MKIAIPVSRPIFFSMKLWWSLSMISTTAGGVRECVTAAAPAAGSPCNEKHE
jgi:hypothetical protein